VTRRTGILAATLGLLVLVGGIVFLWHRGRIDPLPPSVRQPVEDERMARARVDSQLVAATEEARAAQERQDSATTRAKAAVRRARLASDRADSLAHEAQRSASARDSAHYYELAYTARTAERDTLLVVIAEQDTALLAAHDRITAITRAASVANQARQRADSVLDAVVASVVACTVPGTFGRLRCPSRKTALVVGVVVGLGAPPLVRAVKDGRLAIPLRSR
jgi:hypothetical protein